MSSDSDKPCFRKNLDIVPVEHEGNPSYAIRDPLGLAMEPIVVPGEILFIISRMDGNACIMDIQIEFTKKFGELIMYDQVCEIVKGLDERGFLDSPRFRKRIREIEDAYRNAPSREAVHADLAYPGKKAELKALLDEIVPLAKDEIAVKDEIAPPRGLVAPHIDIERGRSIYGLAYSSLAGTRPPKRIVVFGTGHFATGNTYIVTHKDFTTLLGTAPLDKEFCDRLSEACPFDLRKGELAHRSEHSIELQILFLQHVYGAAGMPPIVPVLCTSMERPMGKDSSPAADKEVKDFLDALLSADRALEGETLLVAGADMCHVGAKFGSTEPLSQAQLDRVMDEDTRALKAGAADGADAFFHAVSRIDNRNNICGVASIYTVLKFLEGVEARFLGYDMAVDEKDDSAVGFAALVLGGHNTR